MKIIIFRGLLAVRQSKSYHLLHIKMKDYSVHTIKIDSFTFGHCSLPSRISREKNTSNEIMDFKIADKL